MRITWIKALTNSDDDGDTQEFITLPVFENDTRRVVTMIHPDGHVVGQVRVGSIIHRVMIANGYKVMKS